jgi:septum formation protein
MYKYILASASPRRKDLLKKIISNFIVIPSGIEEINDSSSPEKFAEKCAIDKAEDIFIKIDKTNLTNPVIISADTIVVLNNKIYTKPASYEEAKIMIRELMNRWHSVITGYCILTDKIKVSGYEKSEVFIKKLSEQELDDYVHNSECLDKAGAYGIQNMKKYSSIVTKFNHDIVEDYKGDFDNIVGLPVDKIKNILIKNFLI